MNNADCISTEDKMIHTKRLFFRDLLINRLKKKPTPLYLYWFVTENCNLQCSYCYGNFCKKPSRDLSIEESLQLVDAFSKGGVRRITILGGEPLLYKGIGDVVDRLNQKKISCSILTNGTLVPDKIEVLRGVDEVGLSIDGCQEVHDSIRGPGNFNELLRAIDSVKKIKKSIVLTYTIFSENINQLEYVLEFARKHRVYLTVNLAHGRIDEEKSIPVSKADNESCREALRKIIEYKRKGYPVFRTYRTLKDMLAWPDYGIDGSMVKPVSGFPICRFGQFAACVTADGTLYPCFLGTESRQGRNILKNGFEEAWKHCRTIEHCRYCHVPCFIEYNALLNLSPTMISSVISKLILKPLL